jgi:hypothetical protein
MGCTIFWEAQEFSESRQLRLRDELVSLAEVAGWEYEVAPDQLTAHVINLDLQPNDARVTDRRFRLCGVTLFPFGVDDEALHPRMSFVFDNTNLSNASLRNRLVTIAPPNYWLTWWPRLREQYPALADLSGKDVLCVRGDGNMRVRRTELPGFIKFVNTLRAGSLPLLDIHTTDKLARRMVNDPQSSQFGARGARKVDQESLADIAEGLTALFASARFDEWRASMATEDEIEREQARANRAAALPQDRDRRPNRSDRPGPGGRRGFSLGNTYGSPGRNDF